MESIRYFEKYVNWKSNYLELLLSVRVCIVSIGTCVCLSGYAASDCSMNLNEPPVVDEIDEGNICDTSSYIYCYQPSLLGDNFIDLKHFREMSKSVR